MSDFQRNNTIRLRCFNENSVIDGNLKWAWTVGNNMPITLTFISITYGANLEKVIFSVLSFIIIRLFFDFSNCRNHTRDTTLQVLVLKIHDLE